MKKIVFFLILFFLLYTFVAFAFNFEIEQEQFVQCFCGKYEVPIAIENTESTTQIFDITLDGKDAGNAWLSEYHFSLKPKEKKQIFLQYIISCNPEEDYFELHLDVKTSSEFRQINYQVLLAKCTNIYFVIEKLPDNCACSEKEIKYFIKNTANFDEIYTVKLDRLTQYSTKNISSYILKPNEYVYDVVRINLPCVKNKNYDFSLEVVAEKNKLKSVIPLHFDFESCNFSIEDVAESKQEQNVVNPIVLMLLLMFFGFLIIIILSLIAINIVREYKRWKKRHDFIEEQIRLEKEKYDQEIEDKFLTLEELNRKQEELKRKETKKADYVYEKRGFTHISKFVKILIFLLSCLILLIGSIYFVWKHSDSILGYLGYVFFGMLLLILAITIYQRYFVRYSLEYPEKEKEKKFKDKTEKILKSMKKIKWKQVLGYVMVVLLVFGSLIFTYFIGYFIYAIISCSFLILFILIHSIYIYYKNDRKRKLQEEKKAEIKKEKISEIKKKKGKKAKIKKFTLPPKTEK